MEIFIYGTSEIAFLLCSRLHQDHNITLLCDAPPEDRFNNFDISIVQGSGGDIELLEEIDGKKAELFIACSTLDEANVVACWTIKKLGDIETICFLSKADLNRNFAVQAQKNYRTRFDIDSVIWPEQLLVQDIYRIILVPQALDVEYLAEGQAKLFEYKIPADYPLAGKKIMDCGLPDDVLIPGIMRRGELFIPHGQTVIEADDKVFFMGKTSGIDAVAANFFQSKNRVRQVAIIGGGSVGFMLAQRLEDLHIKVKLVEKNFDRCEFLAKSLSSTLVLEGDGTDFDLLESEEIADADVCICITNNDEKNLLCSLLVKQMGAERVITRAETMQNYRLFEHVGIDVVVSPKASALTEVLNRVQARHVNVVALLGGDKAELLRLTLPKAFERVTIAELGLPVRAVVGMIMRGHRLLIPQGKTELLAGDKLEIFTMKENSEKIKDFFLA